MKKTLILLVGLCLYCLNIQCTEKATTDTESSLDYSQESMWYKCEQGSPQVDVFYITPTCIWDWKDAEGNTVHYMNTQDATQRTAVDGSNFLAASLFSKSCRFYSPYYRQITMNSWMEQPEEIEKRYAEAHKDIVNAFNYYMEHINNGRPFILAGHSQGAKAVLELLKHNVSEQQSEKMVAAYMFGFNVKQADLDTYPQLKPACDSLDCGVIVCFNSVSSSEAVCELFRDNAVCINPINWHTDATYAAPKENLGSVFFGKSGQSDTILSTVGAKIDPNIHMLIIDGLSDEKYYIPSIGKLFPMGNYHVQEINLYFLNVQKNIGQRIDAYFSKHEK